MAVINLGSASVNNASTTVTAICANTADAGSQVVVFVYDTNSSVAGNSVTDSQGNAYTLIRSVNPTANFFIAIYTASVTAPLTTSDAITYHCGNRNCVKALSLIDALGYAELDTATTNTNSALSPTYSVSGAGAVAVVNELYLGFAVSLGATVNFATGWGTSPPTNPMGYFYAAWRINTGVSPLTFNGTASSQWWAAIIVSFKPVVPNMATLAATEAMDVASFPVMDDNTATFAATEDRDVARFIFPNRGLLTATEASDKAFFRGPKFALGAFTVRVSLEGNI